MKFVQKIAMAVVATFTTSVLANTGAWYDLRKIANSDQPTIRLGTTNEILTTEHARSIIEAIDKISLLSGIYPSVFLRTSADFNAGATHQNGKPLMVIDKPMFDYLASDKGATAALIGHEMAHLYFRHDISSAESKVAAEITGFVIGMALEIFFQRRLGIINMGVNVGGAVEKAAKGAFTRPQERQADNQGLIWAIQAGYDPNGAARLFSEMQRREGSSGITFFSTHPSPDERMEKAQQTAEIYKKYKSWEVLTTPELMAMNKKIDEDNERLLPKSEEGINGVMAFSTKDYPKAKSLFEVCAANGEVACIHNMGVFYQFGIGGVTTDLVKAAQYYKKAADKGSGKSLNNYANLYAKSGEGYKDFAGLVRMQKQAAEAGSPEAMGSFAISAVSLVGFGASEQQIKQYDSMLVPQKTLVNYAKTATMRGFKDGYSALGVFYLDGYGVQRNIELAEMYLLKAADLGDLRAVAFLLIIYEQLQIDPDKAAALKAKFVKDATTEESISTMSTAYYCKKDNSSDKLKVCFEGAKQRRYTFSGSYLYGTLLIAGMGTDKQLVEGMAWILHSKDVLKNSTAENFYERIASKLPQSILLNINERAKAISSEAPIIR